MESPAPPRLANSVRADPGRNSISTCYDRGIAQGRGAGAVERGGLEILASLSRFVSRYPEKACSVTGGVAEFEISSRPVPTRPAAFGSKVGSIGRLRGMPTTTTARRFA